MDMMVVDPVSMRRRPSLVLATAVPLGLAVLAGVMRTVGSSRAELVESPLAPIALAVVVAAPGVLALAARSRPALYLPAGLLCVPIAILSVILFPLVIVGVVLMTGTRLRPGLASALGAVGLIVGALTLAVGLYAAAFSHADARCWTTGDATASISRSDGELTMGATSSSGGGTTSCTSDIITTVEALATVGVLALGRAALIALAERVGPPPV